jgi:hypothetical protein
MASSYKQVSTPLGPLPRTYPCAIVRPVRTPWSASRDDSPLHHTSATTPPQLCADGRAVPVDAGSGFALPYQRLWGRCPSGNACALRVLRFGPQLWSSTRGRGVRCRTEAPRVLAHGGDRCPRSRSGDLTLLQPRPTSRLISCWSNHFRAVHELHRGSRLLVSFITGSAASTRMRAFRRVFHEQTMSAARGNGVVPHICVRDGHACRRRG